MKLLGALVLLAACSGSNAACPAAQQAASVAIDRALSAASTEADVLQNAADDSPMQRTRLELSRIAMDEKFEQLEASMECLDHVDCCGRMPSLPLDARAKSAAIIRDIVAITPAPEGLMAVLAPSAKILDQPEAGPVSPNASEVKAWCMQVRGELTRMRTHGADEWNKIENEADVAESSSDAAIAAVQTRVAALQAWGDAVRASRRPSPPPDPSLLDDARPAIESYTSVCK
ncbi:MAG TPA: hypothetical protein VGM39_25175 [Kofleriaceae bacterium]